MSELAESIAMTMRRKFHKLDEDPRPLVPWNRSAHRDVWVALAHEAIKACEKAGIVQREKEFRRANNFPKKRHNYPKFRYGGG